VKQLLRLSSAIDRLNDRIGATVQWLTLAMVLIGSFNAIARYATRYSDISLSSNAYIDAQWYLFSLVFLLGAAYGLRVDAHVRVDVVYSRLSEKARAWIDLLGSVLFLIPFCILMLWVSFPAIQRSWDIREASPDPGGLPRYPIKAVILVCFALLLVQAFSEIVKRVAILRGVELDDDAIGGGASIEVELDRPAAPGAVSPSRAPTGDEPTEPGEARIDGESEAEQERE